MSLDQSLAQRNAKGEAQGQAGSVELPERRAELASRRAALTRRLPPLAFEDYEAARRRGLLPAAVATRGRVCWGCFHHLSPALAGEFHSTEAFTCCPHCERVLFNPDWTERP